jgi:VWFA-related protein
MAIWGLFGCGGDGGSSSGGGGGSPEITLSSSSIPFGNLVINQTSDRSINVQNTGTRNLNVGQITSPAAPFTIASDTCSNQAVAPNGSCTVVVRFSPVTQASFASSFNIPSDDADEGSLTVNLTGDGKGLNVAISNISLNCPTATTATVTVTVTQSNNDPVTGLLGSAFSVLQNGGAVTIINGTFINTQSVPVSVALALDFSNSLVNNPNIGEQQIKDTAIAFINQLSQTVTDRANVYKFAEKIDPTDAAAPFIDADPTGKTQLIAAVNRARGLVGRPTFIFDALDFIVEKAGLEPNNRKAVIVVTDGFDNDSTVTLDDVIAKANDRGVFVFTVGLGPSVETVVLQRLAQETGGQYFHAPTGTDLTAVYSQISLILTNQYQFQFASPVQGGSLNVEVTRGVDQGEDTIVIPNC